MKKIAWLLMGWLALGAFPASAQKLVIGQRAADLRVSRYLAGSEAPSGEPLLIEFFYSPSQPCRDRLAPLNALANEFRGRLSVLLLAREEASAVEPLITGKGYAFSVGLDGEGKTFAGFDVQYVPFSVLLDGKGRVCWFGNSSRLSAQTLRSALGW